MNNAKNRSVRPIERKAEGHATRPDLPIGRLLAAAMAAAAIISLSGCGAAPDVGIRVGDATLDQFEAGVTTEAWLIAVLGKPSSQSVVEGLPNTRVYRYATSQRVGGVAALLSGSSQQNTAVTYFIVTDGVVTRFWADRAKEQTVLGGTIESEPGAKADD